MWSLTLVTIVTALCRHSDRQPTHELLPFCTEHNERTCCTRPTALQAYSRLQKAVGEPLVFHRDRNLTRVTWTEKCLQVTQSVYCSECDGDVGEHLLSGICPSLCETWFNACQQDLFEPGLSNGRLELCSGKSLVCAQLSHVIATSKEFCESMGYAVRTEHCYTGTPSALLRGEAPAYREEEEGWKCRWDLALVGGLLGILLFLILRRSSRRREIDIRTARLKAFLQFEAQKNSSEPVSR